jgi:hypothetical protein
MEVNTNRKRGVFLWATLIFFIFISFLQLLSLVVPSAFPHIYAGEQSWGYSFNLLAFIAGLTAIVGIINWKKWGIYLMLTIGLAEIVVSQVYSTSRLPMGVRLVFNLGVLTLLFWAAKRKWQLFK